MKSEIQGGRATSLSLSEVRSAMKKRDVSDRSTRPRDMNIEIVFGRSKMSGGLYIYVGGFLCGLSFGLVCVGFVLSGALEFCGFAECLLSGEFVGVYLGDCVLSFGRDCELSLGADCELSFGRDCEVTFWEDCGMSE